MQCKIIGGRRRILFILIANVQFVHDDEVACALLCAYRDFLMRYYKFFTVETGSSTNTVELNITFVLLRMKISILCQRTHTEDVDSFNSHIYQRATRYIMYLSTVK